MSAVNGVLIGTTSANLQVPLLVDDFGRLITTTGGTLYPEVEFFADLPAASLHTGEIYVVQKGSGVYLVNRKSAGLYRSDGVSWSRLGNIPAYFNEINFKVYQDADNNIAISYDLTGLTASRAVTWPDKSGTVAFLDDLAATNPTDTFLPYNNAGTFDDSVLRNPNGKLLQADFSGSSLLSDFVLNNTDGSVSRMRMIGANGMEIRFTVEGPNNFQIRNSSNTGILRFIGAVSEWVNVGVTGVEYNRTQADQNYSWGKLTSGDWQSYDAGTDTWTLDAVTAQFLQNRVDFAGNLGHLGDTDTRIHFLIDRIRLIAGNTEYLNLTDEVVNIGAAISKPIEEVTGSTTISDTDGRYTIKCNSATAMTITLPTAADNVGRELHIKNINTGIVTVDGEGAETIDGSLTQNLNRYNNIAIQCDGTEWWII